MSANLMIFGAGYHAYVVVGSAKDGVLGNEANSNLRGASPSWLCILPQLIIIIIMVIEYCSENKHYKQCPYLKA